MTHRPIARQVFAATLVQGLLLTAPAAQAQATAPDDRTHMLEPVFVTARRQIEAPLNVPTAVSSLHANDVDALRITGFDRVGQTVPNLNVQYRFGSGTGPEISLRGQDIALISYEVDVRAVMYRDDANMGRLGAIWTFALANLCGLEVVRGPQGALYGANAAAGVFRLKSCQPADAAGSSLTLETGNHGHAQARLALDTGRHGGFSARLVVDHRENKGWVKNETPGLVTRFGPPAGTVVSVEDFGRVASDVLAFRARYVASPELTLDYSQDWSRRRSTQPALQVLAFYGGIDALFDPAAGTGGTRAQLTPRDSVAADTLAEDELYVRDQSLTAEVRFSPALSAKLVLSRSSMAMYAPGTDLDGAALNGNFLTLAGIETPASFRVCMICGGSIDVLRQNSQELRLRYKLERLDMTLGTSRFREAIDTDSPTLIGASFDPDSFNAIGSLSQFVASDYDAGLEARILNRSRAVFGSAEFEPVAGLALTGGLRWTRDQRRSDVQRSAGGPHLSEASFSYVDWELALRQRLAEGLNAYGRLSTAHVSGGTLAGMSFEPEVDRGAELGLKFEGLQRRLRGSLAIFRTRVSHTQMTAFSPSIGLYPVDAGASTKAGFEAELEWQVLPALRLRGSYGHLRDRIDIGFQSLAPRQTASLGASYEFPRWLGTLPSWRIDASWRSQTAPGACQIGQSADETGCMGVGDPVLTQAVTQPARTDTSTQLKFDEIALGSRMTGSLSLWIRNLAGTRKLHFARDLGNGTVVGTFDAPRTLGLEFSARY